MSCAEPRASQKQRSSLTLRAGVGHTLPRHCFREWAATGGGGAGLLIFQGLKESELGKKSRE